MLTCQACLDGNEFRCSGRGCAAWTRRKKSRPEPRAQRPRAEKVPKAIRDSQHSRGRIRTEPIPPPLTYAISECLRAGESVHEIRSRFSGRQAPSLDQLCAARVAIDPINQFLLNLNETRTHD